MFKRWTAGRVSVLVIGAIAVIALVLLSAGLPNLRFDEPGKLAVRNSTPLTLPGVLQPESSPFPLKQLLIIGAILVSAALVLAIIDKKSRRLFLKLLMYAVLFVLASLFVPKVEDAPKATGTPAPVAGGVPDLSATATPYVPPQVPWPAAFLVSMLLVLVVLGVAYFYWRKRRLAATGNASLAEIGNIAQSALDDLSAGRQWSDAIIQCYLSMNEAVENKRGLYRKQGMTAAEFATHLEEAGLPSKDVESLTHLFEAARYGEKKASQAEMAEATSCLQAIVRACGEAA